MNLWNEIRKASRKELVTLRDYSFGAQSVYWYSTDYDLIGRPTNATDSVSLMREWLYNNRSELAAASIGTNLYGYSYDTIGNRLWSAANLATNTYIANALNQYTSVGRGVLDPPQTSALIYDADGNMTRDDRFLYSYDAENRLRLIISSVVTNGALRVQNAYDHRNRRIRKTIQRLSVSVAQPPSPPVEVREWQTLETHAFVWDGNNIVLEKVDFADGTTRTFEYFWGLDKSGTEQGAGGVGGLIAVSMGDVFYIPCYDHNGNIVFYISEIGALAAQYTYDPYGNIIESSGPLADVFSFGFSTKYFDREIGMVSYQQRVCRPDFGRWLNRDPIEEEGGVNLYGFCGNATVCFFDDIGAQFRFAGDPNKYKNKGDYIALWGPNSGTFSVKWEYEGSDCCGEDKEPEEYGPIFFNATSDYYPVWNTETIDHNVPIPYGTPAFGVNGISGATQGKVYGEKGKMTITITWTSSHPPKGTRLNPTGLTDYRQHGATWNMPNHFPWTKQPFKPFGETGSAKGIGAKTIVVTASWNLCSKEGENRGTTISAVDDNGKPIEIGPFRNNEDFRNW